MNKPSSSSREKARVGVKPSLAQAPSGALGQLRRIGAGISMLAAAACSYNTAPPVSTGPADGGGNQDASADVSRPDTPEADAGVDVRPDAGEDVAVDSGADAGEDVAMDAGMDSGVDAGTDSGTDAGMDVPEEDAGVDVAVVPPPPDEDGDDISDSDDACFRNAARRGHDVDRDGCDDSAICPDGTACDKCRGIRDIDENGDGISDDDDRDGVGNPCDMRNACEIDGDADGQPDCSDPCPSDATNSCVPEGADAGPDAASTLRERLEKMLQDMLKGRGEKVPSKSELA